MIFDGFKLNFHENLKTQHFAWSCRIWADVGLKIARGSSLARISLLCGVAVLCFFVLFLCFTCMVRSTLPLGGRLGNPGGSRRVYTITTFGRRFLWPHLTIRDGAGRNRHDFQRRFWWYSWFRVAISISMQGTALFGPLSQRGMWLSNFVLESQFVKHSHHQIWSSRIEIMLFDGSKLNFHENSKTQHFA